MVHMFFYQCYIKNTNNIEEKFFIFLLQRRLLRERESFGQLNNIIRNVDDKYAINYIFFLSAAETKSDYKFTFLVFT